MKKIIHFITGLEVGGAETLLENLVYNLDEYQVKVLSIVPIGKIGQRMMENGIDVMSLGIRSKLDLRIFFRFYNLIKKEKPDILQVHLFHADFLSRICNLFLKIAVLISTVHNTNIGGKFKNILFKLTKHIPSKTILVSEGVKEYMIKKGIIDVGKSQVIFNSININEFEFDRDKSIRKKLNIEGNQKVLITVGSLTKQKGHEFLIKAMKELIKDYPNLILLIIGKGELREKLEKEIKSFNLEKNIFLLGYKENLKEYLSASDIFVLPSLWEGFGLVIAEAMASGLPVVSTRIFGVMDIIQDRENGFLAEARDSNSLAEKIRYILNLKEEEIEKIIYRARKTVEGKFSLDRMVRDYKMLYNDLLKNKL